MAFNRLRSLAPSSDNTGKPSPVKVPFDEAALIPFQAFRNSCRDWEQSAQGCYKSHLGKLPGHVVRLSCVLVYLDCAASPFAPFPNRIDVGAIERAIFLVGDYLRLHAYRAYGAMQDAPEIRSARKLARLVAGESLSSVTVREIQRLKLADLATAREIETALGVLEQSDWARPNIQATAGRPRRFWTVNPHLTTALHPPQL